jgi:DNA-binding NtrC family response regulator
LFGHEKGAFTGAVSRSIGMLETADKGTLFLDEAGNLTPEVQAKLLQFLNDFTITRVGGTQPIRLDVRVVAASNVPLETLVRSGKFRQDLYYRLNVVNIKSPPLSERREDIAPLARHFLALFAAEQGRVISDFTPGALRKLESHAWPGNVRELSNAIQRAVIFCQEKTVDADHIRFLQAEEPGPRGRSGRAPFRLSKTSKEEVVRALEERHGRAREAAEALGMGRATLYNFLKRNKIDPDQYRQGFRAAR